MMIRFIGKKDSRKINFTMILCALFSLYICINCASFCVFYAKNNHLPIRTACDMYFDNISLKKNYIELYGSIQKALGKKQIEKFSIFKNDFGGLVYVREKQGQEEINSKLEELVPIFEHLNNQNIGYLYIANVLPVEDKTDLSLGVNDFSAENAEVLLQLLKEKNVYVFFENIVKIVF